MAHEGEVESLDDHWIWDDGDIVIVISGVNEVFLGKGVGGCHPSTRCDLPTDIKIL